MLHLQFYLLMGSPATVWCLYVRLILEEYKWIKNKKNFVNDFACVNPPLIYFFFLPFVPSFLLCSVSSFPQVLSDTTVFLLYLLNSAAAALHIRVCAHTITHFLRHKTMSAGRIFLTACSSVYCMILDVLKGILCSHTYLVALSLPFLSPPENWISIAVVSCDVPVPDKSLMSLSACRLRHTHEGTPIRLFVG